MSPSLNVSSTDANAVRFMNTQVDVIISLKTGTCTVTEDIFTTSNKLCYTQEPWHYHPFICREGEGDITLSRSTELKLYILLDFSEGQEVTECIVLRIAAFWISQASLCRSTAF